MTPESTRLPLPHRLTASLRLGLVVLLALVGLAAVPSAAQAEDTAYRYWAYFTADAGAWTMATTGPADVTPADGSVQGMRFAVHGTEAREPRSAPDFEQACGSVEPTDAGARVAVMIDPGTPEDAPDGGPAPEPASVVCVLAEPGQSAADLFAEVAEPRDEGGLICGLDGYPATGCGDPASAEEVTEDAPTTVQVEQPVGFPDQPAADDAAAGDGGLPTPAVIALVAGVVVALVGTGLVVSRRRRGRP